MSNAETFTTQAQEKIVTLADNKVDSTDSDVRYLAYGARLRTALRASTRYIAYVRAHSVFASCQWEINTHLLRPVM